MQRSRILHRCIASTSRHGFQGLRASLRSLLRPGMTKECNASASIRGCGCHSTEMAALTAVGLQLGRPFLRFLVLRRTRLVEFRLVRLLGPGFCVAGGLMLPLLEFRRILVESPLAAMRLLVGLR